MNPFARRRFLALSAAAAGASIFDLPEVFRRAGAADAKDEFAGLPMGVQSYSLREFDLVDAVRHTQGLGLHYIEMFSKHLPVTATDAEIAEVKKLLDKAQIELRGHGVHGFSKDHEANRKLFDFAKRAGVKVIPADPSADSFDSLDKLVAEYDIAIAIHNHGPGARYDKLASVQKAVEGRHKLIGACVDTGHFIRSGEDPVKVVLELGPRVFASHIKDERDFGKPESNNVVIGKGHLDVVALFKAYKKINFPAFGSLSLEYEANPKNPIDDMKACVDVAKEAAKKV